MTYDQYDKDVSMKVQEPAICCQMCEELSAENASLRERLKLVEISREKESRLEAMSLVEHGRAISDLTSRVGHIERALSRPISGSWGPS